MHTHIVLTQSYTLNDVYSHDNTQRILYRMSGLLSDTLKLAITHTFTSSVTTVWVTGTEDGESPPPPLSTTSTFPAQSLTYLSSSVFHLSVVLVVPKEMFGYFRAESNDMHRGYSCRYWIKRLTDLVLPQRDSLIAITNAAYAIGLLLVKDCLLANDEGRRKVRRILIRVHCFSV